MTEERSLVDDLVYRRVPQFVGMYVAATWLVIELGDWVTERFSMPANLTSYVFIAMLIMLPAVLLFAWNHGAPGKDEWTRTERFFIPLNLLLAAGALYLVSPMLVVEAATEVVTIEDEAGVIQEFEVARQGHHREVVGFFWDNESGNAELDWLSYGLPYMLAHDLNRVSPVLSVSTPFDTSGVRNALRNRGHATLTGVPRGLAVEIARDRRSAALLVGSFASEGGTRQATVTVIDAEDGSEIGSHSFSGEDWLTAVDEMGAAVLRLLEVQPADNQSDDPISQHFSDSLEAIMHFTNAELATDIANDYPQAIAELQRALEIDPAFAEASGSLSQVYYFSGNLEAAKMAASEALRSSYRLSEDSEFVLKANRYIFEGDHDRGERVIEIWTQVQPNNTKAYNAMALLSRIKGTDEALEKALAAYDRLLELDPQDLDIYRQKADVEAQRGNYEAAAVYLTNYLDLDPENGNVHIELANIYQLQGDLDAAQTALEDAAILSDDPLASELGLARLEARRGFYDDAEARLEGQLTDLLSSQQRLQVLAAQLDVVTARGHILRALEIQHEANEVAKSVMPPMLRLVRVADKKAQLLSLLGRTEEAVSVVDDIVTQLQPPQDTFAFFTYTSVYGRADDRQAFRHWYARIVDAQDHLAEVFQPFIAMQAATIAIWDGDLDAAEVELDRARDLLGQSIIQLQGDLGVSGLHVAIADLYLQAGAIEKARAQAGEVLVVFPSNASAKLVEAKAELKLGNKEEGLVLLNEAMATWAGADEDYIFRKEAVEILEST